MNEALKVSLTKYQKRIEALELAFKSKAIEPILDLITEAQSIYDWLNPEETTDDND
jgi:uncharacterized coiled-coil protein SlyX